MFFIVLEKISYLVDGNIVEQGTTARCSVFETFQDASDLAASRNRLLGTRDEDSQVLSRYKSRYMYCGFLTFSKFSIARVEICDI